MYDARSDAKNAAKYATSSGVPNRRAGVEFNNSWRVFSGIFFAASVFITPGAIQFAVMPRLPYSAASDFVKDAKAPLVAAYAVVPASPNTPAIDVRFMIRPNSFFSMYGRALLLRLYGTIKFTIVMFCRYVMSDRINKRESNRAALFITMSMRPNFFAVSRARFFVASIAVRSV